MLYLRVVVKGNEPWFIGKDVAEKLGYTQPKVAIAKKVDAEDKGISKMDTPSGKQDITIINESGLYSLILSSKLPTAKAFPLHAMLCYAYFLDNDAFLCRVKIPQGFRNKLL